METKSIFEMTGAELQQAVQPAAAIIRKRAWDKGGYISYFDETLCPDTDHVIREYQDRKELIRLNETGSAELIKIL